MSIPTRPPRRRSAPRAALAALILLAGSVALGGCGLGAGASDGSASVIVTEQFGARTVGAHAVSDVPESETALRLTERNFDVETSQGGRFVNAIDGIPGDGKHDWFFWIDGRAGQQSAADVKLHDGASVWWDRRDWQGSQNVNAVVGQYPAPFADTPGDVALRCTPDAGAACDTVSRALAASGANVTRAAPGRAYDQAAPAVLVGAWRALHTDPALRTLDRGPQRSGVFARFDSSGERLQLLDAHAAVAESVTAGAGLVAAVGHGDATAVWAITGTDAAGVTRAAGALDAKRLRARFALAVLPGRGDVPLPVAGR